MSKLESIVPRHRDCRFFTPRSFPTAPYGYCTRCNPPEKCTMDDTVQGNYVFCGGDTAAKKQIGNAVPPVLAEALYRAMLAA